MRADRDRLTDVLEAIERIERHTSGGREVFDADELVQVWVVRHLQIIGEAVSHLSQELHTQYPDVPWRSIIGPNRPGITAVPTCGGSSPTRWRDCRNGRSSPRW